MARSSLRRKMALTTLLSPLYFQEVSVPLHCQTVGGFGLIREPWWGVSCAIVLRIVFLEPKRQSGSTGYDYAAALLAGGRWDEEEPMKENINKSSLSTGKITLFWVIGGAWDHSAMWHWFGCQGSKRCEDPRDLVCSTWVIGLFNGRIYSWHGFCDPLKISVNFPLTLLRMS